MPVNLKLQDLEGDKVCMKYLGIVLRWCFWDINNIHIANV